MKHILYLPSWFPCRVDPYPGDFIRRHAEAASLYIRITVFFTAADESILTPEIAEEKVNDNLTIYIYYYPSDKKIFSGIRNGYKRFSALKNLYEMVFAQVPPDLVHVHVAYPAGLFALYLKRNRKIPYVISEHDGIYMPGYDNYHVPGSFEKVVVPRIFKGAQKIHSVSSSLANALYERRLAKELPVVIPNVVDENKFSWTEKNKVAGWKFIHVSSLINQKNPEGMLQAMAALKKIRNDFELKILGPKNEKLVQLSKDLSVDDVVQFVGEIPYAEVAKAISESDAMIHFTRYETFGCVIAESLCCGIPVIVSDLPVTRELITDRENGLLVKESDINDMVEKILRFIKEGVQADMKKVAEENQLKFSYNRVGRMFNNFYDTVLRKMD